MATLPSKPRRLPVTKRLLLLIGTRKGAFILRGDRARKRWRMEGPHFPGSVVNHVVLDPVIVAR